MPKLSRSDWYDLSRDMNWTFRYVTEDEVFPEELSGSHRVSSEGWSKWDEPYKIGYREYVHNQVTKDTTTYSLKNTIRKSKLFDQLDPGWKSVIVAHYGAITMPEYLASIGEARMGRFGRSAAWRNTATFGTLDEIRHGQIQAFFPYGLLDKEPRGDWALKSFHTNNWIVIAVRQLFDDMFVANDAVSIALQLTFTLETGFTNLQFLGMAADAIDVGDLEFGSLISSIQTDEARHAQQGEPTIKVLIDNGEKEWGQFLIDHMFWRSWRVFALLTGLSMDYYTPLESRRMSFKEFIEDWVVQQFADQFRDFGLEYPWYWEQFIEELTWYHHAIHLGVWNYRPTVWWNPDAGVSPEERLWLEEKYPGWNRHFGKHWDVIGENIRKGDVAATLPQTLPITCNLCQLPIVRAAGVTVGALTDPAPLRHTHEGRDYVFCSEPCRWIFTRRPERFAGHRSLIDRVLSGEISPPDLGTVLEYFGLSAEEQGRDATDYAWAFDGSTPQSASRR
ncbi:aromatic/alkene/methane monooxygenase hydroxylase/oxygenase subunit alpha [Nocardia paucivorans]|uniref:aromatic/alkene/methane monooxygenase hydroxylase/oxygenase subunit alpha n=1 Tax=Nocardia paucivorans TaxID=114259 RepID=UPI00059503DF|nr:aromatic/alkene/methane monooxygenase hydroxylase/oxygenase subunit alpha [Nocardia paucivorans]